MTARTTVLLIVLALTLPAAAQSAAMRADRPHWSLEIKGGTFYPDIENWKTYYGDDHAWQVAGSLAYKLRRQLDIGVEAGYLQDKGTGKGSISNVVAGNVTYELAPLNLFLLVRGVFSEQQWIVPYAGGGYTRMYYREKIEGQGTVRGSVNGYHGRAGLQFLLDGIDPRAAANMSLQYGVDHTYFFIEVQRTKADADAVGGGTVNLGGTGYLGGFLFEF